MEIKKEKTSRASSRASLVTLAQHNIFTTLQKRDGCFVSFDQIKITQALLKAMASVGIVHKEKTQIYSDAVVAHLRLVLTSHEIPTVEGVQDAIEKVLLEAGEVRLARAYIGYRAKRAEIRKEKEQILEKTTIDDIDKAFDINALRVLKSRYLAKDENGKLIEGPRQLFERVAVHVTLPSLLYDATIYTKDEIKKSYPHERFDPALYEGKLGIGKYILNHHHLHAFKTMYDRMNRARHMKCSWIKILHGLREGKYAHYETRVDTFITHMSQKRFLPNTPALANFGRSLGMGSACFVLSVGDSMESIMATLQDAAFIFKAGGGVGYNFSTIRPEGDTVRSTSGIASGPISFMSLFDAMTEVVKQGGIRRGANMGILNSNHPDIEKFITAKEGNKALRNFNISVLLMGDFWKYYKKNGEYPLVNPRTGKVVRTVHARALFDRIVYQAWESAEPGVIFFDRVNAHNPLREHLGPIQCTNPCGEVLLYPNESCNLGSINVSAFIRNDASRDVTFDWEKFDNTVRDAVEFLDNVIEVNRFPLPTIEAMSLQTRKIGLGIMGLADTLFALRIPYDSKEGIAFMEKIAERMNYVSKLASAELAEVRGSFPLFEKSSFAQGELPMAGFYQKKSWHCDWNIVLESIRTRGLRNSFTTVIAPTGSISMIAGTSSGIEPVFSLVFEKNVAVGNFYYIDTEFEQAMKEYGIYDEGLLKDIVAHAGSLQQVAYLPSVVKKVFKVSHDLTPESHIRALAAFQKWVDSSISKTINFPSTATIDDMKKAYLLAYELGCKDVTVYRDKSLQNQVLSTPGGESASSSKKNEVDGKKKEGLGVCQKCNTPLVRGEGCVRCPSCGWGLCT